MRPRERRALLALAVATLAAACAPRETPQPGDSHPPVVVYSAYDDKRYLPELFSAFTAETGIAVIVRNGDATGIVDDVIASRVTPAADLLLTATVHDAWRAAEEGALRPQYADVVTTTVPGWLRDADRFWVAFSYRQALLLYDPEQVAANELTSYAALADDALRHKLCLSSSSLPINLAVIATLLQAHSVRDTELLVRGWVANLAEPAFASEALLLQAMSAGRCAVAVVSSDQALPAGLRVVTPAAAAVEIEALGVNRHAQNPDAAFELIGWLLRADVQQRHAAAMRRFAVGPDAAGASNVARIAMLNEDARKLAERARYR